MFANPGLRPPSFWSGSICHLPPIQGELAFETGVEIGITGPIPISVCASYAELFNAADASRGSFRTSRIEGLDNRIRTDRINPIKRCVCRPPATTTAPRLSPGETAWITSNASIAGRFSKPKTLSQSKSRKTKNSARARALAWRGHARSLLLPHQFRRALRSAWRRAAPSPELDQFRELDRERRAAITEAEQLKAAVQRGIDRDRQAEARGRRYHRRGRNSVRALKAAIAALDEQVKALDERVSRAAGRHSQRPARIRAGGQRRSRQRRSPPRAASRAASISNPRRIGISAPSWASSISNAPRKSPARASPSIGAWARSWSAR